MIIQERKDYTKKKNCVEKLKTDVKYWIQSTYNESDQHLLSYTSSFVSYKYGFVSYTSRSVSYKSGFVQCEKLKIFIIISNKRTVWKII